MTEVSFTNQDYQNIAASIVRKQAEQSKLNQPEKLQNIPEPHPLEPQLDLHDGLSVAEIQTLDLNEATKQKLISLAHAGGDQNEIIEAFESGGLFEALKRLQPIQNELTSPMGYTPEAYHTPIPFPRDSGIPPTLGSVATKISVQDMPIDQKMTQAFMRIPEKLPEELAKRIKDFMTPANMLLMQTMLTAHAISLEFGVGEIADLVLGSIGIGMAGMAAIDATENLGSGLALAATATSEQDLDESAKKWLMLF